MDNTAIYDGQRRYAGLSGYFKKHWHGDFSLAWSYWVNTLIISVFAVQLGVLALPLLIDKLPARHSSLLVLVLTATGIVLWLWAISGTWASAGKHAGRGGARGWAVTVKVLIVFGILKTVGGLVQMLPGLQEHVQTAFGPSSTPETTIELMRDGKTVRLSGGINDGAARQLRRSLDAAPSVTTVILNSPGGWMNEGERLAQLIKERRLNTYVETFCASACTIAFLAGRDRAADPKARIGFHAVKFVGSGSDTPGADEERATRAAYEGARLPEGFVQKIGATPTNEMWYPTHAELLAAGVLSRKSFGGETSAFATSVKSRDELAAKMRGIELFDQLEEKHPETFHRIVDRAWAMVEQKKSDAEVMAAGRAEIHPLVVRLIPLASDQTLLAYHELLIAEGLAAQRLGPEVCTALFFPAERPMNLGSVFPDALIRRELALLSSVIREADSHRAINASDDETEKIALKLFAGHTADEISVLTDAQTRQAQPELVCRSMIKYLQAFNAMPETQRIRALRVMFS